MTPHEVPSSGPSSGRPSSSRAGRASHLRLLPRLSPDATAVILPLDADLTVVTDLAELMWSVVRRDLRTGERTTLGMIQRRGTGFEVTVLGDPIRMISAKTLTEATAVVASAAAHTKPDQGTSRRRA